MKLNNEHPIILASVSNVVDSILRLRVNHTMSVLRVKINVSGNYATLVA